jgi:hypothetical protein
MLKFVMFATTRETPAATKNGSAVYVSAEYTKQMWRQTPRLMMEALHTSVMSLYFSYTALYLRRLSTPISVLL